jgi:hypothetical protein
LEPENLDKYFVYRHFIVGARINKTNFIAKAAFGLVAKEQLTQKLAKFELESLQ